MLADVLKETRISTLKCAAAPIVFAFVSAPIDMPQLPPLRSPPFILHPFRILSALCAVLKRAPLAPRGCILHLSKKGLSPYAYLAPFRSLRRSLCSNDISDQAKQVVRDAASNGVSITF